MQRQTRDELLEYRFKMYKAVIPAFLVICGVALLLNLTVIWALKKTRIRNAVVILILSLTISDMWTSSVVASSLLYNSYLPIVQGTTVNPCISLSLEIMRTSGLLTGTLHLLLIAFNHWISIVKPHINKEQCSIILGRRLHLHRIAVFLCVCAWVVPICTLILLSISFRNQGYYNCHRVDFYHSLIFRATVSAFLVIIFISIIFFYAKILFILREQTFKPCSKFSRRRILRIFWTAVFICSSFFVGWLPAIVVFVLTCSSCELLRQQKFRTIFLLSCIQLSFILGKSLLNPIIYSLRVPEVDLQIRNKLKKCSKKINQVLSGKSAAISKDMSTSKTNQLAPEDRLFDDNTGFETDPLNRTRSSR